MSHTPFGSFNPSFYGISLSMADPAMIDLFSAYNDSGNAPKWAAKLEDHSISRLGVLSAVDHEVRHFHDFLLSPFSVKVMALRMQATLNGIQALQKLNSAPGQYVPTPAVRWMRWSLAERQKWLDTTGHQAGIKSLDEMVPLPEFDPSQSEVKPGLILLSAGPENNLLAELATGTASAFLSMERLRERSDFGLDGFKVSANDIFEATAHLVQAQAIWQGQGEASSSKYMDYLLSADLPYLEPFQKFVAEFNRIGELPPIKRIGELFTWMLLTPLDDEFTKGNPGYRYKLLLGAAVSKPNFLLSSSGAATSDLWDALDQITKQPPWRHNLDEASAAIERRLPLYRAMCLHFKDERGDALLNVAKIWQQDQANIRLSLLASPEKLADPGVYINEGVAELPLPFVQSHFGWMSHKPSEIPNSDRIRAITVGEANQEVIAYISTLSSETNVDNLQSVIEACLAHRVVDFCFYEELIDSLVDTYFLHTAETLTGKTFVHVY